MSVTSDYNEKYYFAVEDMLKAESADVLKELAGLGVSLKLATWLVELQERLRRVELSG